MKIKNGTEVKGDPPGPPLDMAPTTIEKGTVKKKKQFLGQTAKRHQSA
jgi:hypothetical protein